MVLIGEYTKEMSVWEKLKQKNNVTEEGVVGNWNLITKLILNCAPYEYVKKLIECINEYFFLKKRKTYLKAGKQKVLTSPKIFETIVGTGSLENDETAQKIYKQLTLEDKQYIRNYWDKKYLFIENWTRFSLGLAIFSAVILFYFIRPEWNIIILGIPIVGLLRVFEIMIRHIRIILFDTIGQNAVSLRSPRRSIILLIYNVIEMIFWFACSFMAVYLTMPENGIVKHLSEKFSFGQFIMCSALQFLVYGDGYTMIGQNFSHNEVLISITFWEILVGFIVMLVTFARLFSLLPNVVTQDAVTKE